MQLKKNIEDIYKMLSTDETLLRLLYYKPVDETDNPLDPSKPNIMDMTAIDRKNLLKERIYRTKSVDNLTTDELCRIVFYPGRRRTDNTNFKVASLEFKFDVFSHKVYQEVDSRCHWICDRLEELLFKNRVTGMKTVRKVDSVDLNPPAPNYSAYQLVFEFGSAN